MKFCAACGAAVLPGARFCVHCAAPVVPAAGVPAAPAAPVPVAPAAAPAAPAAVPPVPVASELPPLRPARSTVNVGAVVVGLLAVALIAGGVSFLALRDDPADGAAAAVTVASNTTIADTSTSTIADTSTTAVDLVPAAQLAATRDADRPAVEALVGQWVPQVSATRVGAQDDGTTRAPAEIVALHATLRAQFGALLLWSGDYVFAQGDEWVSIVPQGYGSAGEALTWCLENKLERPRCLARLVTHDAAVGETAQAQP